MIDAKKERRNLEARFSGKDKAVNFMIQAMARMNIPKGWLQRPMIAQFSSLQKKGLQPKNIIAVEIGTAVGYNARRMLQTLSLEQLWLVDPYPNVPDEFSPGTYHSDGNERMAKAKKILAPWQDKIRWVRIPAEYQHAVDSVPDDVGIIYIDGSHKYGDVKKDIELWWEKVAPGGWIGGHDMSGYAIGVCRAVVEFANKTNLELHGFGDDWWMIKPK